MKRHRHPGFFDIGEHTTQPGHRGDPLAGLKARIHWEAFRSGLNRVRSYRVTAAAVHGSPVFGVLVDQHTDAGRHQCPIYAGSAYRPKAQRVGTSCAPLDCPVLR